METPELIKRKIRVAIADDHQIVSEGMGVILEREPDFELAFVAADGAEFLEKLKRTAPIDVAVLDYDMPQLNGLEVLRHLKSQKACPKMIMVSYHKEVQFIYELRQEGIDGYIIKEESSAELVQGIRSVAQNRSYFSQGISHLLMDKLMAKNADGQEFQVTKRELDVLKLIAQGLSTKVIADKLCVSQSTVDTHRGNLLAKFEVSNSIQLVTAAQRQKLLW